MVVELEKKTGPIDVVKHGWIYVGVSLLFLIPGIYFIIQSMLTYPDHAPIRLGIDFTGGTIQELGFEKTLTQSDIPTIRAVFDEQGYTGSVVQIQEPRAEVTTAKETKSVEAADSKTADVKTIVSIRSKQLKGDSATVIQSALEQKFGHITLLQKNSIGPTLASELMSKGLMALLLAYILIIGYLTFRFQFDYAICAIIALVHDTIFVFGVFSMLGYLYHTEVDSLFVTGILTVVGFSVHDTIVVFDRLRENSRLLYTKKVPFGQIANISVNQTLARSINTSFTALLTLLALFFLGGETTRDFVLTMILGIIVGTYSSIFVASAMLAWWREKNGTVAPKAAVVA